MGVRGIWEHVQRHVEPIEPQNLRGKRLAIDVSIWIHESLKGCSAHCASVEKPYLSTLLRRCLALAELGIQPIIVMDGPHYPSAKKRLPGFNCSNKSMSWPESSQWLSPKRTTPTKVNDERLPVCTNAILSIARKKVEELAKALGIPVVKSPGEGEAQCAWLETEGLVDGCITDDFDYFLFGGSNLYRVDFSATSPSFLLLSLDKLQKQHGLNRNSLIALAMLMGCDYFVGIPKVGFVTGLEVLAEFSDDANDDHPETILERFRVYCSKELVERSDDTNRKRRLRNLNFDFPKFNTENSGFPDPEIINLFLRPNVHSITKESLERLCKAPFHENQTKEIMIDECRWSERKVAEFFSRFDRRSRKNQRQSEQSKITQHFPVVRRTVSRKENCNFSKREWEAAKLLKEKARRYNPVVENVPAKRSTKRRALSGRRNESARKRRSGVEGEAIEVIDLVSSSSPNC